MKRLDKNIIEAAIKKSFTKKEVLKELGLKSLGTLNKYIKIFSIDDSRFRRVKVLEATNNLKIYSKGDKHPKEDLYFWQYRYARLGTNSFEVWYTMDKFKEMSIRHKSNNKKYVRNDVLAHITRTALTRDKLKSRSNGDYIDIDYVKQIWKEQDGICYWFKTPMILEISDNNETLLNKVSIDRLDNHKGYIKGNVVLCTNAANRARGNSSVDNWKLFLKQLNDKIF